MTQTSPKDITQLIIDGIQERKGKSITIIDMTKLGSAPAHKFVVAQGTSSMHVSSVADCLREYMLEKAGIKPYNYDGYRQGEWIVIDYGEVIAHIFMPETRARYNLEELWNDAVITSIPDLD